MSCYALANCVWFFYVFDLPGAPLPVAQAVPGTTGETLLQHTDSAASLILHMQCTFTAAPCPANMHIKQKDNECVSVPVCKMRSTMVALWSPSTVVSCEKEEAKPFCCQCGEQKANFQYQFLLRENSCLSKVCLFFS